MRLFLTHLILGLIAVYIGFITSVNATELTIKICSPNICIGGVKWESKPGPHAKYEIIKNLRTCGVNERKIDIEPGWYGITAYDQKKDMIRDYIDVLVGNDPAEITWCK